MENCCPCCGRHCSVESLHCNRGRAHFGIDGVKDRHRENIENSDERLIVLLRRCGHFLHHNIGREGDTAPLLSALTDDERATLESLLEKCLNSWQDLQ